MSQVRLVKIANPGAMSANKAAIFYSSTFSPAALAAIDENGQVARLAGFTTLDYRLIKVTTILNGTTSYTPTSGSQTGWVECVGGGGAGGGAAAGTAATNIAAGGGGGGGGWAGSWITTAWTGAHTSLAVGAGGTQGTAGNNAGGNGGDTTFTNNAAAATVVGKGGTGGNGSAVSTVAEARASGGAGGVAGTGDRTVQGNDGDWSIKFTNTAAAGALSGKGGEAARGYGSGGAALSSSGAGNSGRVYGGGGSGGYDAASTNRQGGVGGNGIIYVWEYA